MVDVDEVITIDSEPEDGEKELSVHDHNKTAFDCLEKSMREYWRNLDQKKIRCCPPEQRQRVLDNYREAIFGLKHKLSAADLENTAFIGKVGRSQVCFL